MIVNTRHVEEVIAKVSEIAERENMSVQDQIEFSSIIGYTFQITANVLKDQLENGEFNEKV